MRRVASDPSGLWQASWQQQTNLRASLDNIRSFSSALSKAFDAQRSVADRLSVLDHHRSALRVNALAVISPTSSRQHQLANKGSPLAKHQAAFGHASTHLAPRHSQQEHAAPQSRAVPEHLSVQLAANSRSSAAMTPTVPANTLKHSVFHGRAWHKEEQMALEREWAAAGKKQLLERQAPQQRHREFEEEKQRLQDELVLEMQRKRETEESSHKSIKQEEAAIRIQSARRGQAARAIIKQRSNREEESRQLEEEAVASAQSGLAMHQSCAAVVADDSEVASELPSTFADVLSRSAAHRRQVLKLLGGRRELQDEFASEQAPMAPEQPGEAAEPSSTRLTSIEDCYVQPASDARQAEPPRLAAFAEVLSPSGAHREEVTRHHQPKQPLQFGSSSPQGSTSPHPRSALADHAARKTAVAAGDALTETHAQTDDVRRADETHGDMQDVGPMDTPDLRSLIRRASGCMDCQVEVGETPGVAAALEEDIVLHNSRSGSERVEVKPSEPSRAEAQASTRVSTQSMRRAKSVLERLGQNHQGRFILEAELATPQSTRVEAETPIEPLAERTVGDESAQEHPVQCFRGGWALEADVAEEVEPALCETPELLAWVRSPTGRLKRAKSLREHLPRDCRGERIVQADLAEELSPGHCKQSHVEEAAGLEEKREAARTKAAHEEADRQEVQQLAEQHEVSLEAKRDEATNVHVQLRSQCGFQAAPIISEDFAERHTRDVEWLQVISDAPAKMRETDDVEWLQFEPDSADVCVCGSIFKVGSEVCRKCGISRAQALYGADAIPDSDDVCICGNVFKVDSKFCRKCGISRAQALHGEKAIPDSDEFCLCGNRFKVDSVFCRKCGASRAQVLYEQKANRESDHACRCGKAFQGGSLFCQDCGKSRAEAAQDCREFYGDLHPSTLRAVGNLARILKENADASGVSSAPERDSSSSHAPLDRGAAKETQSHVEHLGSRARSRRTTLEVPQVLRRGGQPDPVRHSARNSQGRGFQGSQGEPQWSGRSSRSSLSSAASADSFQSRASVTTAFSDEKTAWDEVHGSGREKMTAGCTGSGRQKMTAGKIVSALEARAQLRDVQVSYQRRLERRRQQYGEQHPKTLKMEFALGTVYVGRGQLDEAADVFRDVLNNCREVYGELHPNTLKTAGNLAQVLKDLKRDDEAESLAWKSWAGRQKVNGIHHPDTLRSVIRLSRFLRDTGRSSEAAPVLSATVRKCRQHWGREHQFSKRLAKELSNVMAETARKSVQSLPDEPQLHRNKTM